MSQFSVMAIGKGRMGRWGCRMEEISQSEWNAQMNAALDALPDDARITIVDCHI